MQTPTLTEIIKKREKCYFISPHFDDAVLSAGALITHLAKHTDVTIINVFTDASEEPYTLSAKAFLEQCKYHNAKKLYNDRQKEDKYVLRPIVKEVIDLGFVDALWRKKTNQNALMRFIGKYLPEVNHIYPTYKFHVIKGRISSADNETIASIQKKLTSVVSKDSIVFCPAATGNHIDHAIVKNVCETTFPNLIYWSDFPYNQHSATTLSKKLHTFTFSKTLEKKRALIEGYKTQFTAMFKKGLKLSPETFYVRP